MDESPLPYDVWVEKALRDVIRSALKLTEKDGLPGDHHFYITFRTTEDGVDIPDFLYAQYPEEMTIVLQHRFWDLHVDEKAFSVALTFNGVAHGLTVPFSAVTAFADPSVNFGLQLDATAVSEDGEDISLSLRPIESDSETSAPTESPAGNDEEPEVDKKSGEVITLDAFRKK